MSIKQLTFSPDASPAPILQRPDEPTGAGAPRELRLVPTDEPTSAPDAGVTPAPTPTPQITTPEPTAAGSPVAAISESAPLGAPTIAPGAPIVAPSRPWVEIGLALIGLGALGAITTVVVGGLFILNRQPKRRRRRAR